MRAKTQRAPIAVPVFIYGHDRSSNPLKEITKTVSVSADGDFIELGAPVASEYPVLLINLATGHSISCHVLSVQLAPNGKVHVSVRFAVPSPRFWGIEFSSDEAVDATRRPLELVEA